jgi:hypothetical protein
MHKFVLPLQVSWPAAGLVLHDPTTGTAAANFTTGMTKVASRIYSM